MADAPLSAELASALRDQAFEEIERLANITASYARSTGEAAFRGDVATMAMHLRQVRLCCVNMIQTYKDFLEGGRDGPNVARQAGSSGPGRQDQRPGDGVARGQP